MKWRDTTRGRLATEASHLNSRGDHAGALVLLDRALALGPDDPLVLTYRGRVLHDLGRYAEGEESLRAALAIDQTLSHAWNELGLVKRSKKEFEKAAYCFERSSKISPNAWILTLLANVQLVFDPESSLANARRALSFEPSWAEAQVIEEAAKKEICRREVR